jgi:hypothetical protein
MRSNVLNKLVNYSAHEISELKEEIVNVNLLNEQFRLIQRGIDECQQSLGIWIDAEQGTLQPQLITAENIRNLIKTKKLPSGTDYPNFPFSELSKVITPNLTFILISNIWSMH